MTRQERRALVSTLALIGLVVLFIVALFGASGCSVDGEAAECAGPRCTEPHCPQGQVLVRGLPGDPFAYCAQRLEVAVPDGGAGDR